MKIPDGYVLAKPKSKDRIRHKETVETPWNFSQQAKLWHHQSQQEDFQYLPGTRTQPSPASITASVPRTEMFTMKMPCSQLSPMSVKKMLPGLPLQTPALLTLPLLYLPSLTPQFHLSQSQPLNFPMFCKQKPFSNNTNAAGYILEFGGLLRYFYNPLMSGFQIQNDLSF